MKGERALAFAAFVTICVVWGTTYLAIAIAIETIPPLLLTGIRYTVAGLILMAIGVFRRQAFPRDPKTLINLAVIGFLMVGVGNLAVVWAERWVPSGMAALLVATAPFWMAIVEAFRTGGERTDLRTTVGMTIGFAGVGLLVTPGSAGGSFSSEFILGALAIQVGAICWQLGTVRGKYNLKGVPLLASASLQMLFGGIIVLLGGFAIGEASRFHVNARTFSALAYLTLIGSVLAYSAYVYALAHMRTTKMSIYAYINPIVAVILGWLILGERLTWISVVAMVVILVAVALVQTAGKNATPEMNPVAVEERAA